MKLYLRSNCHSELMAVCFHVQLQALRQEVERRMKNSVKEGMTVSQEVGSVA